MAKIGLENVPVPMNLGRETCLNTWTFRRKIGGNKNNKKDQANNKHRVRQ